MDKVFEIQAREDKASLLGKFAGALEGDTPLTENEKLRFNLYCQEDPHMMLIRRRLEEPDPEKKWEPSAADLDRATRIRSLLFGFDVTTGRSLPLSAKLQSIFVRLMLKMGFKPAVFLRKILRQEG